MRALLVQTGVQGLAGVCELRKQRRQSNMGSIEPIKLL